MKSLNLFICSIALIACCVFTCSAESVPGAVTAFIALVISILATVKNILGKLDT